jgi:hypothetical protein
MTADELEEYARTQTYPESSRPKELPMPQAPSQVAVIFIDGREVVVDEADWKNVIANYLGHDGNYSLEFTVVGGAKRVSTKVSSILRIEERWGGTYGNSEWRR